MIVPVSGPSDPLTGNRFRSLAFVPLSHDRLSVVDSDRHKTLKGVGCISVIRVHRGTIDHRPTGRPPVRDGQRTTPTAMKIVHRRRTIRPATIDRLRAGSTNDYRCRTHPAGGKHE